MRRNILFRENGQRKAYHSIHKVEQNAQLSNPGLGWSLTKFEQKSVEVLISGRVQGVFYRKWAMETARRLGLSGWVRNLYDGRVQAVFSGAECQVESMLARCWQGSPNARVSHLDVTDVSVPEIQGFRQRPDAESSDETSGEVPYRRRPATRFAPGPRVT